MLLYARLFFAFVVAEVLLGDVELRIRKTANGSFCCVWGGGSKVGRSSPSEPDSRKAVVGELRTSACVDAGLLGDLRPTFFRASFAR